MTELTNKKLLNLQEEYFMKKFIKKITHTAKSAVTCVKTAAVNSMSAVLAFNRRAVCSNAGEGYIDTAVKVLIAVVLGALVLAGLYAILNDTVMPSISFFTTSFFTSVTTGAGIGLLRSSLILRFSSSTHAWSFTSV